MHLLKKKIIDGIIEIEGGYSDNPADSGGPTKFGITVAVARDFGYVGDMRNLTRELAFAIYSDKYWDRVDADRMFTIAETITEEVVDTGVNMGVVTSVKMLQRALNVFNREGKLYADLVVDGGCGRMTLAALNSCIIDLDERTLLFTLDSLQCVAYIELCERHEKNETFIRGWIRNRTEANHRGSKCRQVNQ